MSVLNIEPAKEELDLLSLSNGDVEPKSDKLCFSISFLEISVNTGTKVCVTGGLARSILTLLRVLRDTL